MADTDVDKAKKSAIVNDRDGEADGVKEGRHRPPPVDVSAAQSEGGGGGVRTPPAQQQHTPRTPSTAGVGGLAGRNDTLRDKERKIGHRRVGQGGQVTYKKIGSSQIMGSIQLGIHQAVGSLAGIPELDVLIQDFYVVETLSFPPNGSETTPAHPYSDYRFKVYAPTAFRHFRDLFRIAPSDYLVSLCNEVLRELSNPGASGSIFYVTNDDEFIIKTVQHKEAEFLQKLLPGYYMNLNQNPRTLLPKFFGLYTYQCNAKNIRLVTMNNLLPSSVKMHQKYDLKGSTYKRKANKYERNKSSPTYKDLDFMEHHPEGILLEADTYKALMNTLERDCRVLASFKIMDYSLLVGIHNLDQAAREKQERANGRNGRGGGTSRGASAAPSAGAGSYSDGGGLNSDDDGASMAGDDDGEGGGGGLSRSRSINRQRLVAHSTAMESIQADAADPIDEEDHVPPGGIPARNVKGERLLLFLGIIDILQSYRLKKKLEHTLKSMVTDGDTISVHRPNFYAQRFQKFMAERVFKRIPSPLRHSPSRRRGTSLRFTPRPHSSSHLEPGGPQALPPSEGEPASLAPEEIALETMQDGATAHQGSSGRGILASSDQFEGGAVPSSPPTGGSHRSSSSHHHHHHVRSTHHHVTTVAIQEDTTDVVRKGPKLRFKGVGDAEDDSEGGPQPPSTPPVKLTKYTSHTLSVSDVQLETRTDSRSTLSVDSSVGSGGPSGGHGGHRTYTWTPPLSVEGSTPTWTEGTPSFTESSSSGDLGCPTTPIRSLNTTTDSTHHETEMKRIKSSSSGQQHLLRLHSSTASKTGRFVIKQSHSPLPPPSTTQPEGRGNPSSSSASTTLVNGSNTCSVEVPGDTSSTTNSASKYTVTLQVFNNNNNNHEQQAEKITTTTTTTTTTAPTTSAASND